MKSTGNTPLTPRLLVVFVGLMMTACVQNEQSIQRVPSISDLQAQEDIDLRLARGACSERRQVNAIIKESTGLEDYTTASCFDLREQ